METTRNPVGELGRSPSAGLTRSQWKMILIASLGGSLEFYDFIVYGFFAQYIAAHPGEVCPAKWEEGAETLAPSLDLVGSRSGWTLEEHDMRADNERLQALMRIAARFGSQKRPSA